MTPRVGESPEQFVKRRREAQRAWRETHREIRLAREAKYREANREKLRQLSRAFYATERGAAYSAAYKAAWRAANREKYLSYLHEYHKGRADERIWLSGKQVRIASLPVEFQPVARLIKEARREIANQRKGMNE